MYSWIALHKRNYINPPNGHKQDTGELYMPAPYITISKLTCVTCFMENDEHRRRELQMHAQGTRTSAKPSHPNLMNLLTIQTPTAPQHTVSHGKLNSAYAESWRTIPAPAVMRNRTRAENVLQVKQPWERECTLQPGDRAMALEDVLGNAAPFRQNPLGNITPFRPMIASKAAAAQEGPLKFSGRIPTRSVR